MYGVKGVTVFLMFFRVNVIRNIAHTHI